jgi:hypothetical protein
MAQGDLLPSLYSPSQAVGLYVDGVNGNDSTGDGTSGNPWKTLQKASDYIADTLTWPSSGDIFVYVKAATYKATSGQQTLKISWDTAGKRPDSDTRVVWKPWSGSEGGVVIASPDGTDSNKYAIYCEGASSSFTAGYQIFEGFDITGEQTRKGLTGSNGTHTGIYLNGTGGFTTDIEIRDCTVHGFYANNSGALSSAQAILAEAGADRLKIVDTIVHDCGTDTGSIDNQEHGMYIQCTEPWIHNCLVHTIPNGYNIQFFSGDAGAAGKVTQCTLDSAYASGIIVDDSLNDFVIANTIISNHTGRGSSSYGIEFYPAGSPGTGNTITRVVYFNNQGGNRSATPSGWTITNEQTADPKYVSSSDWHIQSDSPAIGYTNTSYASAQDIAGTARPADAEDAGAYEYASAAGYWIVP